MVWANRQEVKTKRPVAELESSTFNSHSTKRGSSNSPEVKGEVVKSRPLQPKAGVFQSLKNPAVRMGFEKLTFSSKEAELKLPKLEAGPRFTLLGNNLNVFDRVANFVARLFRQLYLTLIAFLTRKFKPIVELKINSSQTSTPAQKLTKKKSKQEELEELLRSGPSGV